MKANVWFDGVEYVAERNGVKGYGDSKHEAIFVCAEFSRKADAKRYIKEECYDTPSRVHIIREE